MAIVQASKAANFMLNYRLSEWECIMEMLTFRPAGFDECWSRNVESHKELNCTMDGECEGKMGSGDRGQRTDMFFYSHAGD